MDSRTEGRIVAALSLALGIFGVFSPYKWRHMPELITNGALELAALLFIWAVWLFLPAKWRSVPVRLILTLVPRKHLMWPLLTIALGLSITVGGVAWLYVRANAALPSVETPGAPATPLPPQAAPVSRPSAAGPKFSPAELEKVKAALDRMDGALNHGSSSMNELWDKYLSRMDHPGGTLSLPDINLIQNGINKIESEFRDIMQQAQYENYEEELRQTGIVEFSSFDRLNDALSKFYQGVGALSRMELTPKQTDEVRTVWPLLFAPVLKQWQECWGWFDQRRAAWEKERQIIKGASN